MRYPTAVRTAIALFGLYGLIGLVGCGGSYGGGSSDETGDDKLAADAYRYNARIYVDGKPTTFKLELYVADSVVGLYGRGYLGKGGLRGRLTKDSLEVFFPTTKEYLYEDLTDLIGTSDCPLPVSQLNMLAILRTPPDQLNLDSSITIVRNDESSDYPSFIVFSEDCPWQVEVEYDWHQKRGWWVDSFEFTDGDKYRMWGRLERSRHDTKIKTGRFMPRPSPEAIRIRP